MGLQLVSALGDPERRVALIRSARSLGCRAKRLTARDTMCTLLMRSAPVRAPRRTPHARVIRGLSGASLFRLRYLDKSVALIFAPDTAAEALSGVESALIALLKNAGDTRVDVTENKASRQWIKGVAQGGP